MEVLVHLSSQQFGIFTKNLKVENNCWRVVWSYMTTLYYNTPLIFLVHIDFMQNYLQMIHSQVKKLVIRLNITTKHKFQMSSLSLKWLYLTLKMRLIFPIVLPVKMCEMFPVKCKPGINLDTVFFVWQPANVMCVTGQRAMSLLLERGWRGCPGEKRAVLIPRTAVLLWYHGQAVFVFRVEGHCVCVGLCFRGV